MSRFHPLTVTGIHKTIRDAVVLTLSPSPDQAQEFAFTQGQYLTLRRDFEGEEIRRSYSICASPDDGVLQVGIKKVAGGAFSTWANEQLIIGDTIEAMPPAGRFFAPLAPGKARHYLGFAGGSGITPVLSIIRTVLRREPKSTFTLVYANRAVNSIMFREELEDIKNLHLGRFNVLHVLENDAQEIDLFTGRVSEEKCAALIESGWIDIDATDFAFICGPEPMMLGIVTALEKAGLAKDRIKFELFSSAQPGRLPRPSNSQGAADAGASTTIRVTLDGATQSFSAPRGISVLEATQAQQIDAPYSCKAGVCSTCRCRVIEGEVEMLTNHALEDYEVEKGFVLSCQAYPLTDLLVVDYDQ